MIVPSLTQSFSSVFSDELHTQAPTLFHDPKSTFDFVNIDNDDHVTCVAERTARQAVRKALLYNHTLSDSYTLYGLLGYGMNGAGLT